MSWLVQLGRSPKGRSTPKPSLSLLMSRYQETENTDIKLNCHGFCLIERKPESNTPQFNKFSSVLKDRKQMRSSRGEINNPRKQQFAQVSFSQAVAQSKLSKVKSNSKFQPVITILEAEVEESLEIIHRRRRPQWDDEEILLDEVNSANKQRLQDTSSTEKFIVEKSRLDLSPTPSLHENRSPESCILNSTNNQSQITQFVSVPTLKQASTSTSSQRPSEPKLKHPRSVTPQREGRVTKLKCKVKQFKPVSVVRSPQWSQPKLKENIPPSNEAVRQQIMHSDKGTDIKVEHQADAGQAALRQSDPAYKMKKSEYVDPKAKQNVYSQIASQHRRNPPQAIVPARSFDSLPR